MRYIVKGGIEVRSENAAKPSSQASKYALGYLQRLSPCAVTIDYGCGKARYANEIKQKTDVLYLVDSEVQLTRTQSVHGKKTSVMDHYRRSNSVHVLCAGATGLLHGTADRVCCLNVLSAIPSYSARSSLIAECYRLLRGGGELVLSVQYRNSDFTRMAAMPNATPFLDGYLLDSLRGWSFYGLIGPERLRRTLKRHGFGVDDVELHDGTAFVVARKPQAHTQILRQQLQRAA